MVGRSGEVKRIVFFLCWVSSLGAANPTTPMGHARLNHVSPPRPKLLRFDCTPPKSLIARPFWELVPLHLILRSWHEAAKAPAVEDGQGFSLVRQMYAYFCGGMPVSEMSFK